MGNNNHNDNSIKDISNIIKQLIPFFNFLFKIKKIRMLIY